LYASPDIIKVIKSRKMRWAEHVAPMGVKRNAHKILVGKSGGKRPLRRLGIGWEVNIRMDLRKIGCEGVDWVHLAQDRDQWRVVVNRIMSVRDPQ
jgi:hypothetical protein